MCWSCRGAEDQSDWVMSATRREGGGSCAVCAARGNGEELPQSAPHPSTCHRPSLPSLSTCQHTQPETVSPRLLMTWMTTQRRHDRLARPRFVAAQRALGVPEIVLAIVGYLDQSDLTQTALVNKRFLTQSTQVLYRSPNLFDGDLEQSWDRVHELCETLSGQAGLGGVVRELVIPGSTVIGNEWQGVLPRVHLSHREQMRIETLETLIDKCIRLESIRLCGKSVGCRPLSSRGTLELTVPHGSAGGRPFDLKLVLDIVGHSHPSLQHLDLSLCGGYIDKVLGRHLATFPNLNTLRLTNFWAEPHGTLNHSRPSYRLSQLVLRPAFVINADMPEAAEYDQAAIEWFLGDSRHSIRHLQLAHVDPTIIDTAPSWAPGLETLSIELTSDLRHPQILRSCQETAAKVIPHVKFSARWA